MPYFIVTSLIKIVGILFLVILPMVSYSVYAERRVSAFIQDGEGQIAWGRPVFSNQSRTCSNCC